MGKAIRYTSEWKPFSELRKVQKNISGLGYKKEYVEEHKLEETKIFKWGIAGGVTNFSEPLEVKEEGNEIFWRYNEKHIYMDVPKTFETQFGVFNNYNNGEFISCLRKDNYDDFMEEEKEVNSYSKRNKFSIQGNYCDMFDCGEYTYAISNLMHMFTGDFKIVRIDKKLNTLVMYDNCCKYDDSCLEYAGCFRNATGYVVIASGSRGVKNEDGERKVQKITRLFSIDEMGNCTMSKEWNISIASANSMVSVGDYVYFGQNKMVTRLNYLSGEIEFFTNKTDEELAALVD